MLEIRIAAVIGEPTGNRLVEKLVELGVPARGSISGSSREATKRVYWGLCGRDSRVPALNKLASTVNKLEAFERFQEWEVPTPRFWRTPPVRSTSYPILGRNLTHAEGRDIRLLDSREAAMSAPSDFYTKVIPNDREYRVWVYRDQLLGCYLREQMASWRPRENSRPPTYGRNWWSGWGFRYVNSSDAPRDIIWASKLAVESLGLDFGGVDVLLGNDGNPYVLEVNTCPGADGYCQVALGKLAGAIKQWYQEA